MKPEAHISANAVNVGSSQLEKELPWKGYVDKWTKQVIESTETIDRSRIVDYLIEARSPTDDC
jgi:hypothetical protein